MIKLNVISHLYLKTRDADTTGFLHISLSVAGLGPPEGVITFGMQRLIELENGV